MDQFGGSIHASRAAERERAEGRLVAAGNDRMEAEVERLRAEVALIKVEWQLANQWREQNHQAERQRDEAVALRREIDEWFRQEGAFPDYIQARLDALLERQR
jgi:hypothetical protein